MTRVRLSRQSDHKQQSYCGESDGTLAFVYKIDKKEFHVMIKHCYLMGTNTVQAQQWLENVIRTVLRRKQRFAGGMLISNAVALIQMMRNARVGQTKQ